MLHFDISAPDDRLLAAIREKIDNLNKPRGSLGRLETLAEQICLAQQTLEPHLQHPCHLLLGGDHGIERQGVSATPREVTWQQMVNFSRGGGGVNMFCRQHGFRLRIVDVGVDHDLSSHYIDESRTDGAPQGEHGILNRKIARGTADFLYGPAMTDEQFDSTIAVGAELVDDCHREGSNIVCIGEMGAANTSPSSIWMSLLCGIPLAECIGAGSGLDSSGISHKQRILQQAIDNYTAHLSPLTSHLSPLLYFGGFEMVCAVGAMLRAAELRMIVMVDGFIMTACALAACHLYPEAKSYMIFGHCGDESGHRRMLDALGAQPLLSLGLRLGEGTGALCAYPIVDSAVRMINEMNNFHDANITKYF